MEVLVVNDKLVEILVGIIIAFTVPGITWFLVKRITKQFADELITVKERQRILREETLPDSYLSIKSYDRDLKISKDQCNKDMLNIKENYETAVNRIDSNIKEIFKRLNEMVDRSGKHTRSTD